MKIVHVTPIFHPHKGYQEKMIAIHQVKNGDDVIVLTTNDLTVWEKECQNPNWQIKHDSEFSKTTGIKIIRLRKLWRIFNRIFPTGLYRSLEKEKPSILFIHDIPSPMTMIALFWTRKRKITVIVDDHMVAAGSFNRFSKQFYSVFKIVFTLFLRLFHIKVTKWVAVSHETKGFMIKNYVIKEYIHVIPLGYDKDSVFYDRVGASEWIKENDLPLEFRFILYIGKCDKYKNPLDILAPFKKLTDNHQDLALLIVGDIKSDYLKKMTDRINNLGISNKVFFRRPVLNNEMRKIFSLAQMYVIAHGSSMAMIEGMVCNCPIVAPDILVNRERLSNLRGYLFKEHDSNDLNAKMELALNPDIHIIKNASEWAKGYSWQSLTPKFLE